ncbi:MAG: NAD(P)H-quinone oxidoreductase [Alphaproteobacteria bacterium]|nr:NAD(P)H-quinone oxidoreductase [Alphaproteobacteria bacterium]
MTAIEIVEPGGPEVLKPTERPRPEPELGEILVKVAAAGVNRPDCMQRAGGYAPPPGASDIPGLEVAGAIVALGDGVAEWNLGDEVCALVSGGGYAEYCVVPAPQALPLPRDFDMTRAAAVPETYFTVWTNVFERGRLDGGERFLIHGGASGIGTTAIQLGVAFGARVFATAGTAEKCAVCEELGAERAINYREEDFVAVIGELTGGEGVDLIVDMVGGDYLERNLAALAIEGRLVQIALQHGTSAEINVLPLMVKRLTFTGSTLRPRSVEQKAAIATALLENVWPLLNEGRVGPVMDSTFPLAEAAQAHARMESGAHIGKIVLTV